MPQWIILILLLLFAGAPALAEQDQTYEGTVGSSPIVMQLTVRTGEVAGQYFYRTTRFDIDLSGQWRGQSLSLTSTLTGDSLDLSRGGAGLVGALTTADGRKLAVNLHRAAEPASLPADIPPGLSLYEHERLAALSLTPQCSETVDGKTIRWYQNGLTGIRLFRLESGYPAAAMAKMNLALGRHQWTEISDWLQCPGPDGHPGMDTSEADRPWLGAAYASYLWRSAWYCAGTAHPDFSVEGHSFDTRTGEELNLDKVLPIGAFTVPAENSDAWYDYRSKVFAPAVVELMKRYHKTQMTPPKEGSDCDYTDPTVWTFPSWALTQDGLWLGAEFSHAMAACESPGWAVIPWAALPIRGPVAH